MSSGRYSVTGSNVPKVRDNCVNSGLTFITRGKFQLDWKMFPLRCQDHAEAEVAEGFASHALGPAAGAARRPPRPGSEGPGSDTSARSENELTPAACSD
jgi:hypothetical protein